MWNNGYRWLGLTLVMLAFIAAISVGTAVWAVYDAFSPPVYFTSPAYQALEAQLCPGERLETNIGIVVDRAPVSVMMIGSWWSVDLDYTAVFEREPVMAVYLEPAVIDRVWEAVVPPLPAGKYEYRVAVQEFSSRALVFVVAFSIPEGCP